MDGNGFVGFWKGRKWRGRRLRGHISKVHWKTTRTLRHMLKFHRIEKDWWYFYCQIVAGLTSNRAKKRGVFACISMGR